MEASEIYPRAKMEAPRKFILEVSMQKKYWRHKGDNI